MKLIVACSEFSNMLSRLQGFLGKSQLSPILSNVLIEADESGLLTLSATDTEISFQGQIKAQVTERGSTTVDGKRLLAMVRQFPAPEVAMSMEGNDELSLVSGRSQMSLLGINAGEFPQLTMEGQELFKVRGGVLTDLFERTFFSISTSTDETRPQLTGACVISKGDGIIRVVSTDGHRLSMAERYAGVEGAAPLPEFAGKIVPRKAVLELRKLVDEYPEVELGIDEQNLTVKTEDFSINIRLIVHQFPPYEAVIPKSNDNIYTFDRQELLSTLKRMGLVGEEKLHGIKLDFGGGEVEIESKNNNLGQVVERLSCAEGSSEQELVVAFGVHYMIDVLNVINGAEVQICLDHNDSTPGLFRDPEFEQDVFVVMPKRL